MGYDLYRSGDATRWGPIALFTVVYGLFAVLLVSIELQSLGAPALGVRIIAGLVLSLFAPGTLLAYMLEIGTRSFAKFSLFSVGLSVSVLAAATTVASVLAPSLGVEAPLSLLPLVSLLGALLSSLSVVSYFVAHRRQGGSQLVRPRVDLDGPIPIVALLMALPTLAALGAILMNRFETNVGMYVFVSAVLLVVLLASTRYLPTNLYPMTVFLVSFSTFLHRNLLTEHVVGADIQATYAVASVIMRVDYWSPELGGTLMALPVDSSLPASLTTITGLELTVVYKLIYVLLFTLVPVALYYLGSDVFSKDVGLFGAFVFTFYHISFYFTPEKQLISELFVVLLLIVFYDEDRSLSRAFAILVLSVGLILTHYAMTYVFTLCLFGAWACLFFTRRLLGDFEYTLSFRYPLSLLTAATAWYTYSSSELADTLSSIPVSLSEQIVNLLTGTVEGSGASYVVERTTILDRISLFLYFSILFLAGVGLAYQVLVNLGRVHRGEGPRGVELTAIGIPLFAFLGSSFFVIINLYADRVYQMVLTVLALFVVIGYDYVCMGVRDLRDRFGIHRRFRSWRIPLAVLVALLFAFNSGLAFSLADQADTFTFNSNGHDYAFTEDERAGASWLIERTAITRREGFHPELSELEQPIPPGTVRVYTDSVTYQMFRSELPSGYYTASVEPFKSDFDPRLDSSDIGRGYVFVRERSILQGTGSDRVPTATLSEQEDRFLTRSRNVVYSNGAVRIVEINNETTA